MNGERKEGFNFYLWGQILKKVSMKGFKSVLSAAFLTGVLFVITSCSNISVSSGEQTKIVNLPDGSVVLLNRNSCVEYDKNFDERHIELDGEAFFDVQPGEQPFVVATRQGEIKVLGTEFNVKTQDEQLEVEVDEGTVELNVKEQKSKLKKGECVVYNEAKELFEKGKAEFKHHIWTKELQRDLKKLGKKAKKSGKKLGKKLEKLGKEIKDKVED
ncbi:hypothetical protein DMA11_17415 [Marinilabiliaceae bacterium JC017]|nr:hypothetical protein DMA11_17415 [Marinilabiliaceae bacterium JC017]